METIHVLKDWINAAAEATNDFAAQALGVEQSIATCGIEIIDEPSCSDLEGSCLQLTCGETSIKVCFLSGEDILMKIARIMLAISSEDELSKKDMIDAIKEAINIISGGIKRRLNEQFIGGITLGLPLFMKREFMNEEHENRVIAKIVVAEMPVFLIAISNSG